METVSLGSRAWQRTLVVMLVLALVAQTGVVAAQAAPDGAEDDAAAVAEPDDPVEVAPVRPDVFTAQLTARQLDRRVEIASLTTPMSRTFANPDGTFTDEVHAGPERVFDADMGDGVWRDIDTTLQRDGDTVVPRVAAAGVAFSAGGDGALVTLEGDPDLAELDPSEGGPADSVDQPPVSVELRWPGLQLPEPELDGNVALYRDVEPGVDLELEALPAGYAKRLIVRERPAGQPVWRFEFDLSDGLELTDADGGGLDVADGDGEVVVSVDGLWMWGAARDQQSDEPTHVAEVDARLVRRGGVQVLEVAPDQAFLADPEVELPITIDPTASLSVSGDTFVQSNIANTSQWSSTELRVGTYDGGNTKARSYIRFNPSPVTGKKILSASMELYNAHSYSCTARRVEVRRLTSSFTSSTVWSSQPTAASTVYANPNFARGYSSSCAAGYQPFDVTSRVQAWADGETNHGLLLRAADETDSLSWKKFNSSEATSNRPRLTVTYNSYPTSVTARSESPTSGGFVPDLRPTFTGELRDPDGGTGRVQYRVLNSAGSQIYAGLGSQVSSGSPSPLTLPSGTLQHGVTYTWEARGYDGSLYGPWSTARTITIDVNGPSTPTISSTSHASATDWYPSGAVEASWTASSDAPAGVAGYAVAFNKDASFVPSGTLQTGRTYSRTSTSNGIWYLHVRARDRAGNWGTTVRRRFNIGTAGLIAPEDNIRTQRRVPVQVAGPSTLTSATLQWQRPGGTWTNVAASRLAAADNPDVPLTSNVLTLTSGQTQPLVWDVAGSVGAEDGPIHLRARFNDATVTDIVRIGLDRVGAGKDHGSVDLGPGAVSLLSGNLNVTEADVSISAWTSDLTVTRTHNSRAAAGDDVLFGPGWVSGIAVLDAGSGWDALDTPGHTSTTTPAPYVLLTDIEGAEVWFDRDGADYEPEPGFEDLTLTFAASTYTLTDLDGTTTTFTAQGGTFLLAAVTEYADNGAPAGTTRYQWTMVDGRRRPTRVLAPAPTGVSCSLTASSIARGCRGLDFTYMATGGGTRLTGVDLLAWSGPAATSMSRIRLVNYTYDAAGRLIGATDPRTSPALTTGYGYDAQGRLSTVTPPGLEPWTVTYVATSGADRGRVRAVRRPDLAGGTNQTTLVYDVPRTGDRAPYAMGPADVAQWGQTRSIPTDATAIFPPDAVPGSVTGLPAGAYARADVTYLEASGRITNAAAPGGRITTTEYDVHGNPVRELTAANRATILGRSAADRPSLASRLDTVRIYDDKTGLALLEERSPEHLVELASGSSAGQRLQARQVTRYTYDQGLPTPWIGDKPLLPTTVTVGALLADGSYTDVRTTTTAYNWTLRLPTVTTVDPSGLNIRTTTVYDDAGLEIERRQPSEQGGGGPGTLRTVRYTAGTHPTHNTQCGNRPEWHGQQCLLTPAGQPTVTAAVPGLLTTHTTGYDLYLQPTSVSESAPTSSGSATRTTTVGYDNAGRVSTVAVTASTGSPVPTVTSTYDPATGLPTTTAAAGQQIVRSYDTLGRQVSYTDAAGNVAATSYDRYGRIATANDGRGTRTFTYDPTTWQVTKIVDSHAGIFEAPADGYNPDGVLVKWTGPHGLAMVLDVDASGAVTGQSVSRCTGDGCDRWWSESVVSTIHGQWLEHDRPIAQRDYRYDAAGRLTQTVETVDEVCTTRRYAFGNTAVGRNSNRTAKTILGADPDGACSQTPVASTAYSYDTADRLVGGPVYDGLGRTLTVPGALLDGAGELNVTYFGNDLVATLTQDGQTRSYTLDPAMRFATETDTAGSTMGWRYANDSDSPAWHATPGGGWVRNVAGLGGDLAAILTFDGQTTRLTTTLTDLQGSVVMHIDTDQQGGNPTPTATLLTDEFGSPLAGPTGRYGWHGAKQRHTALPSGAILMGVRLYLPQLGRFAQVDPVLGGSANGYEYASGDSVNNHDLDGRMCKARVGTTCTRYWKDRYGRTVPVRHDIRAKIESKHGISWSTQKWLIRNLDQVDTEGSSVTYSNTVYQRHCTNKGCVRTGNSVMVHMVVDFKVRDNRTMGLITIYCKPMTKCPPWINEGIRR